MKKNSLSSVVFKIFFIVLGIVFFQKNANAQGCVIITQPAQLTVAIAGTDVACHGTSTGAANLSVSGGTSPYTYAWSNTATSEDLTNIPAGSYSVTVTDNHGCSKTTSISIAQPAAALSASIAATAVACNGASTGAANLSVSGGTSPYTYAWSNSATSEDLINIPSGAYSVVVTDNQSCNTTVNVTIAEPAAALSASIAPTDILCNGASTGAADLSVSGGTSPYTYAWSNGTSSQDLTATIADTYTVTITDNQSCKTTANVTIAQPTALNLACGKVDVTISGGNNGQASVSPSGGVAPYTYVWSTTATSATITNLTAGTYAVTVTDNNGCTKTCSSTVNEPGCALLASAVKTNVLCNGGTTGTATVTASGNIGAVTYTWSNGANTASISGLIAGNYSVTISESLTCKSTASVTVGEPTKLSFTTAQNNVACYGGFDASITVSGVGGISPYTYSLDDGATFPNSTGVFGGLNAGAYKPAVKDDNGCITKCQ